MYLPEQKLSRQRKNKGAQITEFAAALVVLIVCIVFPLIDLSVIPIHFLLSKEIIEAEVEKLAKCKTFGNAIDTLATDDLLISAINNIGGTKTMSAQCHLIVTMLKNPYEVLEADQPKAITKEWLPGGQRQPCNYEIELSTNLEFSPLILAPFFAQHIPGLTEPFKIEVKERAPWENYGRDPTTKKFYMEE